MKSRNEFINSLFCLGSSQKCYEDKGKEAKIGTAQAFAEVYHVLHHCDNSIVRLIPNSFMLFLRENMDKAWRGNLDFTKNLNDMKLLDDTRVILSLVYRDFLCSDKERKELIEKDREEAQKVGWEYEAVSLRELFQTSE